MKTCNHKDKDNNSSIIFNTARWFGIFPKKIKGVCTICGKNFELTKEEYEEFKKGDV